MPNSETSDYESNKQSSSKKLRSGGVDLQGPLFIQEPPHRVEFSNSSGGKVDCTAHGSPPPEVEWISADGSPVHQVPDLRLLFPNGSLVFPPFSNDRYRHDVHAAIYRCRLKSSLGVVVSREIHVKADEFLIIRPIIFPMTKPQDLSELTNNFDINGRDTIRDIILSDNTGTHVTNSLSEW
ncbi:hypothetical protein JTB14_004573 [Gonioctena quinquepunctata]|nr:hypothetical protein JTB14_004573 [Gonioctena quinquepunctata]